MFANHGALHKHNHEMEGINSRMDGIQAAILSVKLRHIDNWNNLRLENAIHYDEMLINEQTIDKPQIHPDVKHVFHLYVIRSDNRTALRAHLIENGVSTGIHYPTPLPFLRAYEYLGHTPQDFPVAHNYMSKILSLPMFPELSYAQIDLIANIILEFQNKYQADLTNSNN